MENYRIYKISFAKVYPLYVAKAEKKGRTKAEVDQIISWLTGYGQKALETQLEKQTGGGHQRTNDARNSLPG